MRRYPGRGPRPSSSSSSSCCGPASSSSATYALGGVGVGRHLALPLLLLAGLIVAAAAATGAVMTSTAATRRPVQQLLLASTLRRPRASTHAPGFVQAAARWRSSRNLGPSPPLTRAWSSAPGTDEAAAAVAGGGGGGGAEEQQQQQQTTTTRRRKAKGKAPSREHIGVAKGTDVGRFRTYSADQFVKAATGLPAALERGEPFTVMGIETSCDDTGVAIVRSDGAVLGEALASQHQIHEEWGGVVPGLARDAHAAVIDTMVQEALVKAGMASAAEVDAVAVTVGPGLEICLRVGCETAKRLAAEHGKPFVAVHHLEAHCLMARLGMPAAAAAAEAAAAAAEAEAEAESAGAAFPFLALLVSGGHCMILECQSVGRYRILGGTLDDALGEAYDKAARLLRVGTGTAGGPAMEKLARDGDPKAVPLPVPMQARKDMNFSYAGLKNAFRMAVTRLRDSLGLAEADDMDHATKADLAASFQNVAIQHLEERLERAMRLCDSPPRDAEGHPTRPPISTLAVVGGVAANQAIRGRLSALCERRTAALAKEAAAEAAWAAQQQHQEEEDEDENKDASSPIADSQPPRPTATQAWRLVVPPPRLCTDNGVMVAWAAVEKLRLGYSDPMEGQDVYARWPFASPPPAAEG